MNVVGWLKSGFSARRKALWSYRRGMARAKRRDYAGALASYTAAIDLVGVPTDVRAMALYNRALAYVAAGDDTRGVNDLESVMAIDGAMALVNIRTMAAQKLARVESRINTSDSQKR